MGSLNSFRFGQAANSRRNAFVDNSASKRVLTLPDYRRGPELLKSSVIIDSQNEHFLLVANNGFLELRTNVQGNCDW